MGSDIFQLNCQDGIDSKNFESATLKTPLQNRGPPPKPAISGSHFKFQLGLTFLRWCDPGLEAPKPAVYS